MLEQVGDEPAEVLTLLRELLQERERTGGVAVDDRVTEAEERVLLDGAEKLQHGLDVDLVPGRRCELVERRDRVSKRAAAAACDQRERTVGRTLARSVVQKTKTRCGGGSSISFRSAFQAASVS